MKLFTLEKDILSLKLYRIHQMQISKDNIENNKNDLSENKRNFDFKNSINNNDKEKGYRINSNDRSIKENEYENERREKPEDIINELY